MNFDNLQKVTSEIFDFYKKKHEETIPVEVFIKKVELEFKVKLSEESKEEVLKEICLQENVKIVTNKFRKKVISRKSIEDSYE